MAAEADLWPLDKLERRLSREQKADRRLAVLLTTGALNPIHLGHVAMMELAKERLERCDPPYSVVAGYISASNDLYVGPKMRRTGDHAYTAAERLRFVALSVHDSGWLSPGRWESSQSHWPNFPEVCQALETELSRVFKERQWPHKVKLFYVCGEDHFRFIPVRYQWGVCVVPRSSGSRIYTKGHRTEVYTTASHPAVVDLSSTRVRRDLAAGSLSDGMVHPEVKKALLFNSPKE